MSEQLDQRTAACRAAAVREKYPDRCAIARECELIVLFLGHLQVPLSQWAGHGQWATLAPATRADLGTHTLATIDTTLTDLASIRTRLAATLTSPPDLVYPGASLPDLEVLGPAHAVTRAFHRFVVPTRFISISLNQSGEHQTTPRCGHVRATRPLHRAYAVGHRGTRVSNRSRLTNHRPPPNYVASATGAPKATTLPA